MIEAMKQALEALEKISMGGDPRWADDVMPALRQAIEQAEKNDLERLRDENERLHIENRRLIDRIEVMGVPVGVGGYLTTTTTPQPQREWHGLTDEERRQAWLSRETQTPTTFAQDIEDKLKEKNGC